MRIISSNAAGLRVESFCKCLICLRAAIVPEAQAPNSSVYGDIGVKYRAVLLMLCVLSNDGLSDTSLVCATRKGSYMQKCSLIYAAFAFK